MHGEAIDTDKPRALQLLASKRPRNVGWLQTAGLLFGDWGTSRLYVLGLALFFAGRCSLWLIGMMSLLILAVGWAYTQISRIYPDGGGVYTAAKRKSQTLAVIGALLLFADYTVTASLSVLDAFHYFGLPMTHATLPYEDAATHHVTISRGTAKSGHIDIAPDIDAGKQLDPHRVNVASDKEALFRADSPGLWAVLAIAAIGLFSLAGPGRTGAFAIGAAIGMVFITLLICCFALPQINWHALPGRVGSLRGQHLSSVWISFCSIVLALSGVEAVANLTGVMVKPVTTTSKRAIWTVATEVAVFNFLLGLCMIALPVINRDAHLEDMAAFLSAQYVGRWGELAVRCVGGALLLSAGNTAITAMISIQYLMARDGELPRPLVHLNRFGVPWIAALIATGVPICVLLAIHDLDRLASLYAMGVVGAVTINISMCCIHPRLRKWYRRVGMGALALLLLIIWVSIAFVKHDALIFVSAVLGLGLVARQVNRWFMRKYPQPTLLQQAIAEQLGPDAMAKPRIMLATYGSEALATAALAEAKRRNALLVVGFVREVHLSYKYNRQLNAETDIAAMRTFSRFLELAHKQNVPIMPVYDAGADGPGLLAEDAAVYGCQAVMVGVTRRGRLLNRLRRGSFLDHLRKALPPAIPILVINSDAPSPAARPDIPVPG